MKYENTRDLTDGKSDAELVKDELRKMYNQGIKHFKVKRIKIGFSSHRLAKLIKYLHESDQDIQLELRSPGNNNGSNTWFIKKIE